MVPVRSTIGSGRGHRMAGVHHFRACALEGRSHGTRGPRTGTSGRRRRNARPPASRRSGSARSRPACECGASWSWTTTATPPTRWAPCSAIRGHSVAGGLRCRGRLPRGGRFEPDVVLLDIQMPEEDGLHLAPRIRQQPWGRAALLVAVTGLGRPEDRRATAAAGFDAHLVKPVDFDALGALLESAGQRAWARSRPLGDVARRGRSPRRRPTPLAELAASTRPRRPTSAWPTSRRRSWCRR